MWTTLLLWMAMRLAPQAAEAQTTPVAGQVPLPSTASSTATFPLTLGGPALIFALPAINENAALAMVHKKIVTLNDLVGMAPNYPSQGVIIFFFQRQNGDDALLKLSTVARKYLDKNVRVLAVCVDPTEDLKSQADWVQGLALDIPVLRDNFQIVAERYGIQVTPTVVVVDSAGRIFSAGAPTAEGIGTAIEGEIEMLLQGH